MRLSATAFATTPNTDTPMLTERIDFPGPHGKLSAKLDAPAGTPRAYGIFAHCFTCSKDVLAATHIARGLAALGVAVLRFDFAGLGSSHGDFADTNFSSNVEDLVAAADYLREKFAAPQLLIGHSLGGAAVLAAAHRVPEAKAVVTIAAPSDPHYVVHKLLSEHLDTIAQRGEARVKLAGRDFNIRQHFVEDAGRHRLHEKIATLGRALLVMHAPQWFAQREFNKLKKALDCDDEDLREAQAVIRQCNPHPGAAFGSGVSNYVVPDVIVRKAKGGWSVTLNNEVMPRLRVNNVYANLLKGKGEGQMSAQLQEAKWLIKNMRQRFDTILRVAQAIVERQRNFFSHGAVAMRPLVLREIADTLGLHESTISRVTTQKYMLTPHGMFELKYFFGSHVATEAGGKASSTAIRALIKQLIGAEDPKNPFSDSKIADMLGEQGMVVARRTVAKYREALKIPPVNLRKAL